MQCARKNDAVDAFDIISSQQFTNGSHHGAAA
jgi:hypothetical protein